MQTVQLCRHRSAGAARPRACARSPGAEPGLRRRMPLSRRQLAAARRVREQRGRFVGAATQPAPGKGGGSGPKKVNSYGRHVAFAHCDAWYDDDDSSDSCDGDDEAVAEEPEAKRVRALKTAAPGYNASRQAEYRVRRDRKDKERAAAQFAREFRPITTFFKRSRPAELSEAGSGSAAQLSEAGSEASSDSSEAGLSEMESDARQPARCKLAPGADLAADLEKALKAATRRGSVEGSKLLSALLAHHNNMGSGQTKYQSSRVVGRLFYPSKGKCKTRRVKSGGQDRRHRRAAQRAREAYETLRETGAIPETKKRACGRSLIHDSEVKLLCRSAIQELPKRWSAAMLRKKVSARLVSRGNLPEREEGQPPPMIAKSTCSYWLTVLGCARVNSKKGIYKDGHERKDVRKYRRGYVRDEIEKCGPKLLQHEGEDMCQIVPIPGGGEPALIPVLHDEMTATSMEHATTHYREGGAPDEMYRKGRGSPLMVSGFECPCHGILRIADPADVKKIKGANPGVDFKWSSKMLEGELYAMTVIKPGCGAGKEGHWGGADVVEQLKEYLPMFEFLHPGKQGLITFDNSTNHGIYPPGALKLTSGCNKNPGGKNAPGAGALPAMIDGWHVVDGEKKTQKMHQADGQWKGTAAILAERGFDVSRLRGKCTVESRKKEGRKSSSHCTLGDFCCCHNVLQSQPDFQSQLTALELVCSTHASTPSGSRDHICRMLPKFHPELSPIESYWAAMKQHLREHCDFTFRTLEKNMPQAALSVPIETVRRHFNRARRFNSLCHFEGNAPLDFKLREYAMRLFSKHREVPATLLAEIDAGLARRKGKAIKALERGVSKTASVKLEKASALIKSVAGRRANPPPSSSSESDCSTGTDAGSESGIESGIESEGGEAPDDCAFEPKVPYDLRGRRHARAPVHRMPMLGDHVAREYGAGGWFVGTVKSICQKTVQLMAKVSAGRATAPRRKGWGWFAQVEFDDGVAHWFNLSEGSYGEQWALLLNYTSVGSG